MRTPVPDNWRISSFGKSELRVTKATNFAKVEISFFALCEEVIDAQDGRQNIHKSDFIVFDKLQHFTRMTSPLCNLFIFFEGISSTPTALTANDRNRRIQIYQASDG